MTGPAPTPGRPEKENVRAMFDAIAPRYDVLNRVLSARVDVAWRKKAVRALGVRPGDGVLDLATGTGDLLLEELGAGAVRSVGADLSFGMLRLVRPKFASAGYRDSRVCQGDAERLPFADACFDGASIAFGMAAKTRLASTGHSTWMSLADSRLASRSAMALAWRASVRP